MANKIIDRCDQCPLWVWEETGSSGIPHGHCPSYTSRDGCDFPCDAGVDAAIKAANSQK